jgi:hypothetical protein
METVVNTCRRRRVYSCKIDKEQSPGKAFNGPLHSRGLSHEPHEHIVLETGYVVVISETSDAMVQQTGLSSQSSPYSSIFANRS